MNRLPFITVVIPAYNEEFSLPETLRALKRQEYPGQYEILVVDNASTDRTAEIARSMGARVIEETRQGYVHAIRRGFGAANGEIIACTDADTLVAPDWLDRMAHILEPEDVVATSGAFRFFDGPWWIRMLGRLFGGWNWHLAGANMAVKKTAFQHAGGFNGHINLGADVELGFRMKKIGRLVIDPSLIVHTSSRRFSLAFWTTIFHYYVNDLCLVLFRRPLFYEFANYRLGPAMAIRGMSAFRFAAPALIMLFFIGWMESPDSQFMGSVFARGTRQPQVALTFDDGPSGYTAGILDTLAAYHVPATFFVIGENAARHPDLVKRAIAEGHAIGNHTWSHPILSAMQSSAELERQLDRTDAVVRADGASNDRFFRPPHGWRSPGMLRCCAKKGYTVVTWTVDARDWIHSPPRTIEHHVLDRIKPGAIILLHDGLELRTDPQMDGIGEALSVIIRQLRAQGYTFVTVPELYAESQKTAPPQFNPLALAQEISQDVRQELLEVRQAIRFPRTRGNSQ